MCLLLDTEGGGGGVTGGVVMCLLSDTGEGGVTGGVVMRVSAVGHRGVTGGVVMRVSAVLASTYHWLECELESQMELEFFSFSVRHFLKLDVRGFFLGTLDSFPPSLVHGSSQ